MAGRPLIHHVALEVAPAAVEAETAFWTLLGWAPVEAPPGLQERSVWLARADQQIHLLVTDAPSAPAAGHVALVGLDPLAALRDAGHPLDERERHWGAERWMARSPAGHRVELMASPP